MVKCSLPSPESLRGVGSVLGDLYPSGTLWPTGEFSLGYARTLPDGGFWHENPIQVSNKALGAICDGSAGAFACDAMQELADCRMWFDGGKAEGPPLDLSDTANSHKRRKARGTKGITGYGRSMVKSAGHLMAKLYPRHRTTFCTVTLPPLARSERSLIASGWAEVVRQVLQTISRRLTKAGVPRLVVSVSEVQPSRLEEGLGAYLHLHLIWLNRPGRRGNWAVSPEVVRKVVSSVVAKLIGRKDIGHINVDVKPVKGSVAAYMSKYMSKGSDVLVESMDDWGEDCCPSSWWNMTGDSRALVECYKGKGVEVGRVLEQYLDFCWNTGGSNEIAYLRPIEVEFDGVAVTVGYRGRFEPPLDERIRRVLGLRDIAPLTP